MKKVCILGSTGSIGTQALDVISKSDNIKVNYLSTNKNINLLKEQMEVFKPKAVVVCSEEEFYILKDEYKNKDIDILYGIEGLIDITTRKDIDLVLNGLMGNVGIIPTINAIEAGKDIALANKETLVSAGDIIIKKVKENNVKLLPVDSEHSAIFQCLQGNEHNRIKKIYLTASGGPFRNTPREDIAKSQAKDALKHPNWDMGNKISIDSATLMNKGLEIIEAKYLFDLDFDQIEVIVHPESIIHSMVEFEDTTVMAQLGMPDMRPPIAYALNYPNRGKYEFSKINFFEIGKLNFIKPRYEDFPCLDLAIKAGKLGGTMAAMVNSGNEVLVEKYINNEIGFYDISDIIELAMNNYTNVHNYSIEDVLDGDKFGRDFVNEVVSKK